MEICKIEPSSKLDNVSDTIERDLVHINIKEGQAEIITKENVFYNPVQQFNRDLSISVLTVFANEYNRETGLKTVHKLSKNENNNLGNKSEVNVIINSTVNQIKKPGIKYENGIKILEALSATGLRSIRYAKEVPGVKSVIANDWSMKAAENISENIKKNSVEHLVTSSCSDAVLLMHQHKNGLKKFSAVDLDPYGCPSIFLDSAVQCVEDGGILLITATDMAVLAGNSPETCYSKYNSISLRLKCCHEMALRILLQCIESHANRYSRYIVPQLCISADFYIRVFVKIFSGAAKCKATISKLSMVYTCVGCESFTLHPLGMMKTATNLNQFKYCIPVGIPVGQNCIHCNSKFRVGGPIWSAAIHNIEFVRKVLQTAPQHLVTWKRIQGVLSVICEELIDVPLYYTLERLSSILHIETPPMIMFRSVLLNAGYHVSYSHAHKMSIKTDAPVDFIWDILRSWEKIHPIKREKYSLNSPVMILLSKEISQEKKIQWSIHLEANPQSRKHGFVRFQENPAPHWGPGTRATAMVNDICMTKSKMNQGKYTFKNKKREHSNDSSDKKDFKMKTEDT